MEHVSRRKRHLLQMMYMLKLCKPELVEKRDLLITLRSDKNIAFHQENLNSEIFVKAPQVISYGSKIQHA